MTASSDGNPNGLVRIADTIGDLFDVFNIFRLVDDSGFHVPLFSISGFSVNVVGLVIAGCVWLKDFAGEA